MGVAGDVSFDCGNRATPQVFARKLITLTSLSDEAGSCFVTGFLNRKVDSVLK
jgi:hypothetical protein